MENTPTSEPLNNSEMLDPTPSPMESLSEMPSFDEHMKQDFDFPDEPTPGPIEIDLPTPTPEPEGSPYHPYAPTKKRHTHEHNPSRNPDFLRNQAIAKKEGQHMVGNEKRPYLSFGEITQKVASGENIHELIKNVNAESVWHHMVEYVENGASIEEVFDNMPKSTRWLSINELVQNGYDVNKLAGKLSDTEVWLQADKFVKNGADVKRLRERLSRDDFLRRLIDEGKLLGQS